MLKQNQIVFNGLMNVCVRRNWKSVKRQLRYHWSPFLCGDSDLGGVEWIIGKSNNNTHSEGRYNVHGLIFNRLPNNSYSGYITIFTAFPGMVQTMSPR